MLIVLIGLLEYYTSYYLFTDQLYRDTLEYIAGKDRINAFLANRFENQWKNTLVIIVLNVMKLVGLTLAVLIGFALYRVKVSFREVLKTLIVGEFILIVPVLIKVIWFTYFEELVVLSDYQQFNPWSLQYYLSRYTVPFAIFNLSSFVNVFEILALILIVYLLKRHSGVSYFRTATYSLIGYVPTLTL
jgi:hypothetical protein